jgi:hypothetical protein
MVFNFSRESIQLIDNHVADLLAVLRAVLKHLLQFRPLGASSTLAHFDKNTLIVNVIATPIAKLYTNALLLIETHVIDLASTRYTGVYNSLCFYWFILGFSHTYLYYLLVGLGMQ